MKPGATQKDASVRVNGCPRRLRVRLLSELLQELGHPAEREGIAVALNDEVVPRGEWSIRVLSPGDRVEIVEAVQGG